MEEYRVRVTGDDLVFSAAHFITLEGDVCEALHGHDYRVAAEVAGPLDENSYVVDFVALRDSLKSILGELDHHVLLPTGHPLIRVTLSEQEVQVTFGERRWAFPRSDCVLLPIPNTTTELLARHVGRQLAAELRARGPAKPSRLRVRIDEARGYSATCELRDE
jgi:6-pyruvoyltetrahydropterin/6-carboxytetrahydropterin synthase